MTTATSTYAIASDPSRTAGRIAELEQYMRAQVLNAERHMVCRHYEQCKESALTRGNVFAEGQLSHVGKHYDLSVDGAPVRIVMVGQEPGLWSPGSERIRNNGVTLEQRYELICNGSGLRARYYADSTHPGRNPHMRGTTSALRILLGQGLGSDHAGEFLQTSDGSQVHLFDAFALVNVLLCAAGPHGSSQGRSTATMRRNCLEHFDATMRILRPTIVILQGRGVQRWLGASIQRDTERRVAEGVSVVTISGTDAIVCNFAHPSARAPLGWGNRLDSPYLLQTVQPALTAAMTALTAES